MRARIPLILLLLITADIYFYQAVETLTTNSFILSGYWMFDLFLMVGLIFAFTQRRSMPKLAPVLMTTLLLTLVPKLFGMPVLALEDVTRIFRGFPPRSPLVSELALVIAAIPFIGLIYGLTRGRHNYRVHKETLYFNDLPDAFDGFTITQLSDIHSGSFSSEKGVSKGINLVNKQNSDLILFTGDLVNNLASEMDRWIPFFSELKAPYGKFSVLGNHDYGDYVQWENEQHQQANLSQLKNVHKKIGFNLLLNEAVPVKKKDESLALIGVENWGKGGFHKYGDLDKATQHVPDNAFKILMSHDPSHWDAVTLDHDQHIHLTLSGHTHGMQFGLELPGFRWSPVQYVYRQWAGLYEKDNQKLYINRGFGFIGYPGRVGILPEITVIELG